MKILDFNDHIVACLARIRLGTDHLFCKCQCHDPATFGDAEAMPTPEELNEDF
jgi:hypothetical protein